MTCTAAPPVKLATAEKAQGGGDGGSRGTEEKQSFVRWQHRIPAGNAGPGAGGVAGAVCAQPRGWCPGQRMQRSC